MIKPCAYDKRREILKIINKNLNVIFSRDITLDENFLSKLYKNEKNIKYKKINTEQLKGGRAIIGVVAGKNAIRDLITICGDKPLGSMCNKETIQNGVKRIHWTGGEPLFKNSICEFMKYAKERGYEEQSMTTNGFFLERKAQDLKESGISRINVSV